MAAERKLVVLSVSPWSERARWALDHHKLAYQVVEHRPFLGERRLRRLVGSPRPTVPALVVGIEIVSDSWDIARYAEREGSGPRLIPAGREAEVARWNELGETGMRANRHLVVQATLASPRALDENLPAGVPGFLRVLLRPVSRYGMRWFARKHELDLSDGAGAQATLRAVLAELRATLAGGPYLLGAFSYADIVMATLMQGIVPVADRYLRLGPATRAAWTQAALAEEFADLVAWRDAIYAKHR